MFLFLAFIKSFHQFVDHPLLLINYPTNFIAQLLSCQVNIAAHYVALVDKKGQPVQVRNHFALCS